MGQDLLDLQYCQKYWNQLDSSDRIQPVKYRIIGTQISVQNAIFLIYMVTALYSQFFGAQYKREWVPSKAAHTEKVP